MKINIKNEIGSYECNNFNKENLNKWLIKYKNFRVIPKFLYLLKKYIVDQSVNLF